MRDTDFQEVDPALTQEFRGFGSLSQAPQSKGDLVISTQDTIITAQKVAVPRDLTAIMTNLKVLARMAGDNYYYAWETKNKNGTKGEVFGPTIKLANDVAREYGNCVVGSDARDIGDHWLIAARFVDLQTGYSLTRLFQQRKGQKVTKDADRDLDIAFQIGQSKAIRNVITNALQSFTDFALEEAKKSLVEKFGKDLPKFREMALERLAEMDIAVDRVERLLGRAPGEWTAKDLARISANLQGIRDGMTTIDDTFPVSGGSTPPSAAGTTQAPASPPPVKGETAKPAAETAKPSAEEKKAEQVKAAEKQEQPVETKKEEPKPADPPKAAEPAKQEPLVDDSSLDLPENLKRTKDEAPKKAADKPKETKEPEAKKETPAAAPKKQRAAPSMDEPKPDAKAKTKEDFKAEFVALNEDFDKLVKEHPDKAEDLMQEALDRLEKWATDNQEARSGLPEADRKWLNAEFNKEWAKFM